MKGESRGWGHKQRRGWVQGGEAEFRPTVSLACPASKTESADVTGEETEDRFLKVI